MNHGTSVVPKEMMPEVIDRWKQGESAGMIARWVQSIIGKLVTRNTIMGLLSRAKVKPRGPLARSHTKAPPTIKMFKPRTAPQLKPKENEPEVLGPPDDFPAIGTCRYTKDDVAIRGWRMCGQQCEQQTSPFCNWHLVHRIYNTKHEPSIPRGEIDEGSMKFNFAAGVTT